MLGQVRLCLVRLGQVITGQIMLCQVMKVSYRLGQFIPG
jgi:hypothetical protein